MKASCLLMQTQKILWGASKSIKTPQLHFLSFHSRETPLLGLWLWIGARLKFHLSFLS